MAKDLQEKIIERIYLYRKQTIHDMLSVKDSLSRLEMIGNIKGLDQSIKIIKESMSAHILEMN